MFQEFDCCLAATFQESRFTKWKLLNLHLLWKSSSCQMAERKEKRSSSHACMRASQSLSFWNFQCFNNSFFWILEWCKLTLGLSWRFSTFIHDGVSQNVYCVCDEAKKWDRNDEEDVKMWKSWRCFSAFSFSSFFIFSPPHHLSHSTEERTPYPGIFFSQKISLLFNIWQSPRHTLFLLESHDDEKFLFQFIQTQFFSIGNFLLHLFTQLFLPSTFFCLIFLLFFLSFSFTTKILLCW